MVGRDRDPERGEDRDPERKEERDLVWAQRPSFNLKEEEVGKRPRESGGLEQGDHDKHEE